MLEFAANNMQAIEYGVAVGGVAIVIIAFITAIKNV